MAENKNSFILHVDLIHTLRKMTSEKRGDLFLHILEYVNDENPVTDDLIIELTFEPIKQQLIKFNKSQRRKEFHWNWKGGITSENSAIRNCTEMKYWRISVFERDNYMCVKCNEKGGKLNAHHIKKFSLYPELRFDVSNGLTLCSHCHKIIHSLKNNNHGRK